MWGFVDSPNKVKAGLTQARGGVVIIADGRAVPSMAGSELKLLSNYGRLAGLWARIGAPLRPGPRQAQRTYH
eukprot:27657-Pyramimonas_sp.AAC.1